MELWLAIVLLSAAAIYSGHAVYIRQRMRATARAHREMQANRAAAAPLEDALGTFTCDGNVWSAKSGEVRLAVYGVDREDLGAILDRHRAFAAETLADDGRVRRAAATKLVDVYNQRWRGQGDAITPEDLAKELILTSIRLPSPPDGGPFLVFRATSWVFAGHGVQLALTSTYDVVE